MSLIAAPNAGQVLDLRRATPVDRDALIAMYLSFEPKGASFGLPPRKEPEHWLDGLRACPNFIMTAAGRIAGHAVLCGEGESAEVAVFVHQDFRGRGLGKQLLRALVEEAQRLNLRRVWGMSELDNVPMLRLARSLGFVSAEDPREFHLELPVKANATPAGVPVA